jgi:hypothetical protein
MILWGPVQVLLFQYAYCKLPAILVVPPVIIALSKTELPEVIVVADSVVLTVGDAATTVSSSQGLSTLLLLLSP